MLVRWLTGPEWRRRVTYAAAELGWWHKRVGENFADPPHTARLLLRATMLHKPEC